MKRHRLDRKQGGVIMLMVLALLAIGSLLSASFYALLNAGLSDAYQRARVQTAMNLADAGLEKAVASLRTDPNFAGEENTWLGEGVFSVTATAGTKPGTWQIVSTGTFHRTMDSLGKLGGQHKVPSTWGNRMWADHLQRHDTGAHG